MNDDIAPYGEICYYRFPARGSQPPLRVTWYSGGLQPPRPDLLPEKMGLPRRGVLFVGEKGILQCDGAGGAPRLFPNELREAYRQPEKPLPRSKGHHRDWLDAIKGGPPTSSHFLYGARLTEITLLGIVALRVGKQCQWDADAMKVKNADQADAMIKESYRKGWEIG